MVLCDDLGGWQVGGRPKREGREIFIYVWLIHFIV